MLKRIFCLIVCFGSFSVRSLSENIQKDAASMMEALSRGDIQGYYRIKNRSPHKKKIFRFVNDDGDNMLHFLVRLERFERFEYSGHPMFISEQDVIPAELNNILKVTGSRRFINLLTQENSRGVSPLMEAAFSSYKTRRSSDEWRAKLSPHLSQDAVSKLLGPSIPVRNQGLAYEAISELALPPSVMRSGFAMVMGLFFISVPLGVTAELLVHEEAGLGIIGAAGFAICALAFSDSRKLKKFESHWLGMQ